MQAPVLMRLSERSILSLRELITSSSFRFPIFLALYNPRISRQKTTLFKNRSQTWLIISKCLWNSMSDRASLSGETSPGNGACDIIRVVTLSCIKGLRNHHSKNRSSKVSFYIPTIHCNLSRPRLDPYPCYCIFSLARCIRTSVLIYNGLSRSIYNWLFPSHT